MPKHLLIPILLSFSSFAQITIDENDFFDAEDTARVSYAVDLSIDFSSTGSNSNWDFSQLSSLSQAVEEAFSIDNSEPIILLQFGTLAPSEYRADYTMPFSGLSLDQIAPALPVNLPISLQDVKRAFKKTGSKLTVPGFVFEISGQQIGVRSDIIETVYQFPLNFNDSYTSAGVTEIDLNPIYDGIYSIYRNRSSEVDGYGSITLPNETYSDVLRIHHTIVQQDSIYIGALEEWFGLERTIHNYEWLAKNEMRPVLRITTNEVLGVETVSEITYRDIKEEQGASLYQESNFNTLLYPNPVSGILNIESEQPMQQVSIFNSTGKRVIQKSVNNSSQLLDLSSFSPGLYTVVITTPIGIRRSKLIVR